MFDGLILDGTKLAVRPYHPTEIGCVAELTVMMLFMDEYGRVAFVLPRRANPLRPQWQSPQGRVRHGEIPYVAGLRELSEEVGVHPDRLRYNPEVTLAIQHSPHAGSEGKLLLGLFYSCQGTVRLRPNRKEVQAARWVENYHQLPELMEFCSPQKRRFIIRCFREAARQVHDFRELWGDPPRGRFLVKRL